MVEISRGMFGVYKQGHSRGLPTQWNPLTDDGDAFRLAVKLDIVPRRINTAVFAWKSGICDISEPVDGQYPMPATRRAIVRAAAEIGKTL